MEIRGSKARYNILSLGQAPNNMLMWSYYSGGHAGFVVGVEIADDNTEVEPVQYVEELRLDEVQDNLPKYILSRKLRLWDHEQEYRVFKQNDAFVKVKVKELIFGLKTDNNQKEMLTKIAKQFCPEIEVTTITRDQLDTGEDPDNEF